MQSPRFLLENCTDENRSMEENGCLQPDSAIRSEKKRYAVLSVDPFFSQANVHRDEIQDCSLGLTQSLC